MFSDKFNVDPTILRIYGAVDLTLICDLPLFIDPILIFNSKKEEYKEMHDEIINYFHFLAKKAQYPLSDGEIKAWFCFPEVKNNWLGYSMDGNCGSAFGMEFAKFLAKNISFVIEDNDIPKSKHIEKIMLLYKKTGRDKISDMVMNIAKYYFLEYTEKFAKQYIPEKYCNTFYVDKVRFDYETETFISKEYYLPYIYNKKGKKEFVILTPIDILRKEEPSINFNDFSRNYENILDTIDNEVLKAQLQNYIIRAVQELESLCKLSNEKISLRKINKEKQRAFIEFSDDNKEVYDYYIKTKEGDVNTISKQCVCEVNEVLDVCVKRAEELKNLFDKYVSTLSSDTYNTNETAYEKTKERVKHFKHVIEKQDGYKLLYLNEKKISDEKRLQLMFKFVWNETEYKADFEPNNGRGPADMVLSKGKKDQCVVEFKLASNTKLKNVFKQTLVYMDANQTEKSIIVICYFTVEEFNKVNRVIKANNYEKRINEDIFLIDCRNDNKISASNVK